MAVRSLDKHVTRWFVEFGVIEKTIGVWTMVNPQFLGPENFLVGMISGTRISRPEY